MQYFPSEIRGLIAHHLTDPRDQLAFAHADRQLGSRWTRLAVMLASTLDKAGIVVATCGAGTFAVRHDTCITCSHAAPSEMVPQFQGQPTSAQIVEHMQRLEPNLRKWHVHMYRSTLSLPYGRIVEGRLMTGPHPSMVQPLDATVDRHPRWVRLGPDP